MDSVVNGGKSCAESLYIEIDRKLFEETGALEHCGEPILGRNLFGALLEEYHGLMSLESSVNMPKDIIDRVALNDLLKVVGGKSGAVAGYMVKNRTANNTIRATMETLSKKTGASIPTVHNVIHQLMKHDLIRKRMNAEYMVSPALVYSGKFSRCAYLQGLYRQYNGPVNVNLHSGSKDKEEGNA